MSVKVGILHIHGMSKNKEGSHEELIGNIKKHTKLELKVRPVYYYEEMQANQDAMLRRMGNIGLDKCRSFVISSLGDVGTVGYNEAPYRDTMARIKNGFEDLSDCTFIAAITHSFGAQVLSCYIWDEMKAGNKFEDLQFWFSTGCNIPAFVSGMAEDRICPIRKPHPTFKWINFWAATDILGFPLKPINAAYSALVEDVKVDSLIPFLSHSTYDGKREVYKRIAKELNSESLFY